VESESSKLFQKFLLKGVITVGNVLGIIIGVVAIVLGLVLLFTWWSMFIKALMALVPILLIVIGAGILIYFVSEIKSKLEMGKEQATSGEKKPE
jgi:type III secretory pathway component EscV